MIKLFHGSNMTIDKVDLSKSRPFKDFGRAFYLSADEQQAWERAYAAITLWGGTPKVTSFELDEHVLTSGELKVLSFDGYTEEWADFIFANRKRRKPVFSHDYDIVYGPIADDKVGLQISRYQLQYIPMEELIRQLSFIRPTFQYFFGTARAISLLHKIE